MRAVAKNGQVHAQLLDLVRANKQAVKPSQITSTKHLWLISPKLVLSSTEERGVHPVVVDLVR